MFRSVLAVAWLTLLVGSTALGFLVAWRAIHPARIAARVPVLLGVLLLIFVLLNQF